MFPGVATVALLYQSVEFLYCIKYIHLHTHTHTHTHTRTRTRTYKVRLHVDLSCTGRWEDYGRSQLRSNSTSDLIHWWWLWDLFVRHSVLGLMCSWIQMAAFIQRPWFWLKICNSKASEIIRCQKGQGGWEETGVRFPWGVVVLFGPSTNDDTYGKKTSLGLFQGMTPAYRSFLSASRYDQNTVWTTNKSGFSSRFCPD